ETLAEFSKGKPTEVVKRANEIIVGRARRYVYARDDWQRDFIKRTMSTKMEPTPLFKELDRSTHNQKNYPSSGTTPSSGRVPKFAPAALPPAGHCPSGQLGITHGGRPHDCTTVDGQPLID